ncbi:alcohol oxidase [Polyplosphaeria fusca]|uniref:Alcohol oxidase n=1 Tax=Polyplosphaeria fusca TaxID=682080 RepID=A0A9P4QR57_9PLEO|nr:alcohol oxidase [Polyplosphaeria fusca]
MSAYEEGREYDIVFAGGGTAACVAAGRLAQADPSLSILIIERGRNNLDNPLVRVPGLYCANFIPATQTAIFYQAESEPSLNGVARTFSTGGVLGGGSSINAMMYSRAQAIDFDSFNTEGWDSKTLIEFAKKLETSHLPDVDDAVHGSSGPINISNGPHAPKGPQEDFLAAAKTFGFPEIGDLQDFKSNGGFTRLPKYISLDGTRQDAAHRYVHPLRADGKHPNFHLLVESRVRRVLFEGDRAVGVEYEPEPTFMTELPGTKRDVRSVKARKQVVVSAGVLGTPSILERSGVGKRALLDQLSIPVVSDLPGVGEEYQDHHFLLPSYKTSLGPEETLDRIFSGRRDYPTALKEKDPTLGWNGIDVAGKLRMTEEEATALGPQFKAAWTKDFAHVPSKPVMLMGLINFYVGDHKLLQHGAADKEYATLASYTPYPYSRGSIHITSADCLVGPKLITGFLADKDDIDLKMSMWAYKKGRDIYRRTNAFAGELQDGHPTFREGSRAALAQGPLKEGGYATVEERMAIPAVEYDEEDDGAIEEFIRNRVTSTWHGLGTCKMAPREKGGVVDKDLNVYGTKGLKCADLSIIPENVGSNTNNMALIVGEKAADIIGKELGIKV